MDGRGHGNHGEPNMRSVQCEDVTGLVLAGGRSTRMGGLDKGLRLHNGMPLAQRALQRLQPQVKNCAISANRHLEIYAEWGVPVFPDEWPEHPGPLAGVLAGLERCQTPWLATVPCDSPQFPLDLVERLAQALGEGTTDMAMAETQVPDGLGGWRAQPQPVFCLVHTGLAKPLRRAFLAGERSLLRWGANHGSARVRFPQAADFLNINTPGDLNTPA
jgi:molybdopterin-guanine dinucleotide biosynthesis protein A